MKALKPYILLTLLCALLYLPGIFSLPIVDRDAPHFAQATRQILETGDYFQIKFQDKPRHLKPPGIYWLQAMAVKAFSTAKATLVWPYRLPSVVGGWLAVLLTFAFARRFYSDKVALLAAGLLGSSLLLTIESHLVVTDAVLLTTMVLMQGALWQIYVGQKRHDEVGWFWPILFWLAMGAGILIKGITPLVGFLTLISLSLMDRNLSLFKKAKFGWGILLLLLSCAWLIPVSLASHSNFLIDMIHGDVMPKLVGGQQSHGMPPGYFLVMFNLMFWPGALFVWHGNMWGWNQRKQPIERFLLAWIIPTWIFFAIVPTKLPEYVLPTYPAIAILIAKAITSWQDNRWAKVPALLCKFQYGIWGLFGLVFAGAFVYLPYYLTHQFSLIGFFSAAIILVAMIGAFINIYQQYYARAAVIAILGSVFAFGPMFQWVLPNLKPLWVTEKLVTAIHQQVPRDMSASKPLLSVGYTEPSLVFMTGTRDVLFTSRQEALQRLYNQKSQLVVVEDRFNKVFLQAAKQDDVKLKLVKTVQGFNYSRGRWVKLDLYKSL